MAHPAPNSVRPSLIASFLAFIFLIALSIAAQQSATRTADTILYDGKLWTVDPARPEAEAIAITGDTIVRVGSNAEVMSLRGPQTRVVDLHGARVLPGFNDAHTHFENATQWFYEARLIDVTSTAEVKDRVAEAARRVPAGMWITAYDAGGLPAWSHSIGGATFQPALATLDEAAGDHPLMIRRYDGVVFINSKAMTIARLKDTALDPLGGHYGRDPVTNRLNGMMYGKAADLLTNLLPPATMASKLIAAHGVLATFNSLGITSIHDIARLDAISQLQTYNADIERS